DPAGLCRAEALFELRDALIEAPVEVVDLVACGLHLANGVPLQQVIALPLLPRVTDAAIELDRMPAGTDHPEEGERHATAQGDVEVLFVGWIEAAGAGAAGAPGVARRRGACPLLSHI